MRSCRGKRCLCDNDLDEGKTQRGGSAFAALTFFDLRSLESGRRVMSLCRFFTVFALIATFAAQSAAACWPTPFLDSLQAGVAAWQKYKVDDEDFSVLLPAMPAMKTSTFCLGWRFPDCIQSRRARVIAAYAEGVVYGVYSFQRQRITMNDVMGRFRKRYDGAAQEKVKIGAVSGNSFRFENDDRTGIIQFFATSDNFYVFEAVGSKLKDPQPLMAKFFSSITFESDPVGIEIKDGPGAEQISNPSGSSASDEILTIKQTTVRPFVLTKPEPSYTDAARKAEVVGTVVLRAVFSSSGGVESLTVVRGLPHGLTERAIEAARGLRFIPGIKDGRFVSTSMQLEYNFNLY